ncbi:Archaeal aspartate aminotransferase or a related aminotransferase [Commensalibacter communis]|uniref:pyridoxal-phosphate-dependent aminotransferase family protein n=1 Tax=Commensalibacter communis TaxID=2972786 RepID=UPI0022FF5E62|nr:alanine--glyoxylate aminotransferase family protein [Commensalibacter communis]CAI3954504.1 Archaeal aspartate aminotransferase or a related aminotransferase [Commensalibacter communis]CAI3955231.1 Archaeal aspartate aminotransferase or a related aminotransferase [Commensalibacter communis]
MTRTIFPQIDPPQRLLMGPGPSNTYPRVLRAMAADMLGQFDPEMTSYMNETMALYRDVFMTDNQWTLLINGTARAAIEAALVSLCEPENKVLIINNGRFGLLLSEISERIGAKTIMLDYPWGEVASLKEIEQAIVQHKPHVFACVHGDTSTTTAQPLEGVGEICRRYNVYSYVDATATLGAMPIDTDQWGIDIVSASLQKSMGGPPGCGLITISDRAAEFIFSRAHTELGLQEGSQERSQRSRIGSNYFDLAMIMNYWSEKRLNHHTEATSMLYAAREAACIILEEGLENCFKRHRLATKAISEGARAMGLALFGNDETRMYNVTGIYIPNHIDGEQIRAEMRNLFEIEIGSAFGPLKGKIWRIGTMGHNARPHKVFHTLMAFETILRRAGLEIIPGKAIDAAFAVYEGNQ